MKNAPRIWYHGTNKDKVDIIIESGFREGTYFAASLQDAIGFGGEYIFEVVLNLRPTDADEWQVCTADHIPPDQILRLKYYDVSLMREFPERVEGFQALVADELGA